MSMRGTQLRVLGVVVVLLVAAGASGCAASSRSVATSGETSGGAQADQGVPAMEGYEPDPGCSAAVEQLSSALEAEYGQMAREATPADLPFTLPDDLLGEVACTYAQFTSTDATEPRAYAMWIWNPDNWVPGYLGTSPDLSPHTCAEENATCYLDADGNLVAATPRALQVDGVELMPGTAQVVVHLIG